VREEGENRYLVWTGGLEGQAFLTGETRHDAPSRNIQKHNTIRKGTVMQTSAQEQQQLSVTDVQHLLERQGYEMLYRFGYIHATRDAQEWHVCLVADLTSMPSSRLLACLDEALMLHIEQSIALSPHV
jgi:hypothetical protein